MKKEIERKFLVEQHPISLEVLKGKEIYQSYLVVGEEEIRVRKTITKGGIDSYSMTIKHGVGLTRNELEVPILKETYEQLLKGSTNKPLWKYRFTFKIDEVLVEMDVYQNSKQEGLKTIEVEFDSEEEAKAFIPPSWFGKEVTEDERFKNQYLWKEIQK